VRRELARRPPEGDARFQPVALGWPPARAPGCDTHSFSSVTERVLCLLFGGPWCPRGPPHGGVGAAVKLLPYAMRASEKTRAPSLLKKREAAKVKKDWVKTKRLNVEGRTRPASGHAGGSAKGAGAAGQSGTDPVKASSAGPVM
jgi:hypothetical protein